MSVSQDENSITFDIKTSKDIKAMQAHLNKIGISEEKKYIALEFAENMIEAKLTGSIKINDVYIINVLKNSSKNHECTAIKNLINKAKDLKKKNATKFDAIDDNNSKAILSILYADWDLNTEEDANDFSIIARKNASILA